MTERKFPHGLALLVILLHRGFSLWMFCVKFGSGGLIRVCSSSRNNPRHCALIWSGKTKSAFVQYSRAAFSHSLHTSALLIHKCRLAFSAVWIYALIHSYASQICSLIVVFCTTAWGLLLPVFNTTVWSQEMRSLYCYLFLFFNLSLFTVLYINFGPTPCFFLSLLLLILFIYVASEMGNR